jgi:hypothetical protein
MTLLQELPLDFSFVKSTYQGQIRLHQAVQDTAGDGTTAPSLRANEVTVMALNEIAVAQGRGFFWHLPTRDRLKNDRNTTNHGKEDKKTRRSDAVVWRETPPDRMAETTQWAAPPGAGDLI